MNRMKLSKSLIVAIAFLAGLSPQGIGQEQVDTVHVSQPKSQDLGADAESKNKNGPTSAGGSFGGLGLRGNAFSNPAAGGNSSSNQSSSGRSSSVPGISFPGTNPGGPGMPGGPGNPGGPGMPGGPGNPNNPGNPGNPGGPGGPGGAFPGGPAGSFPGGGSPGGGGGGSAGSGGSLGSGLASPQSNQQEALNEFCAGAGSLDSSWPGGCVHHTNGPNGPEVANKQNTAQVAGQTWPFTLPGYPVTGSPFATGSGGKSIWDQMPAPIKAGTTPASASELATITTVAQDAAVEAMFQPSNWLQVAKEVQNTQTQANADNAANMEKQQAGCAIDFVRTALENFTVNPGNQWNRLRNELFMPMAVLLLLPGAIATQAKATVAQGFQLFGEVSPVEGIYRSIVAIFLIPGTYLIVNYGIDLSNSIAYTIQSEYFRIFGSDMYRDAMCAHIRAYGSRLPSENKGYVPKDEGTMGDTAGRTARASFEANNVNVKIEDPCAGLYQAPESKANEKVPYAVNSQRAAYNGMGAGLAMTWNILCAFQMCYLYYLWFVGPIMAALWVWPVKQLREAFPNWCEGVITICFWSLFWNTTVLLMACFRGIDDTGTVIMSTLNFLSTACVKFAFDFAGLVKAAGAEAGRMAEKAAQQGSKGGASSSKAASRGPGNQPGSQAAAASSESGKHGPGSSSHQMATASHSSNSRLEGDDRNRGETVVHAVVPPPQRTDAYVPGSSSSSLFNLGDNAITRGADVSAGAPITPGLSADSVGIGKVDMPGLNLPPQIQAEQLASGPASAFMAAAMTDANKQSSAEQQSAANELAKQNAQAAAMQSQDQLKDQLQAQASQDAQLKQQEMIGNAAALAALGMRGPLDEKSFLRGIDPNAPVILPPSTDLKNPAAQGNLDPSTLAASNAGLANIGPVTTPPLGDAAITRMGADLNVAQSGNMQIAGNFDSNSPQYLRPGLSDGSLASIGTSTDAGAGGFNLAALNQAYMSPAVDAAIAANLASSGSNQQLDPRIIDLPGNVNKVTVDLPTDPNLARPSAPDDNVSAYIVGGSNLTGFADSSYQTSASNLNYSSASYAERSSLDANAAAAASEMPLIMNSPVQPGQQPAQEQPVLYRQQQDTVIEEKRSAAPKSDPKDQTKRAMNQNQKYVDQERMQQARSAQPPAQGAEQGKQQGRPQGQPAGRADQTQSGQEPLNETEKRANTPLSEQVRYGSILRRSRDANQMSEEEEELMRKLASNEEPEDNQEV